MSRMTSDQFVNLIHETYRREIFDRCIPENVYRKACSLIPPVSFNIADVQHIIDVVDKNSRFFPSDAGGIVISALANKVMNSTDTLYVNADLKMESSEHFYEGFYYGAFLQTGTLIFPGDSFFKLGYGMKGGTIIVKGKHNSSTYAPGECMKGGDISIEQGFTGDCDVGTEMSGGTIKINGDVKGVVGRKMTGGTIHINGDLNRLGSNFKSGTIIVERNCNASYVPGDSCFSGKIVVNGTHRGYNLGYLQGGGEVIINEYEGDNVGWKMEGGRIEITKSNVCSKVGFQMKGGEIKYRGNCESVGNSMIGGKIIISHGNAERVGVHMEGGQLIIDGNTFCVGSCMKGGVIKVNGDIQDIYGVKGGEIYQHDKRLPVGNPISRALFNIFREFRKKT